MTRRKPRSRSRYGLFDWTPDGDVRPGEIHGNPLAVPCRHPPCKAREWDSCTNHRGEKCAPHPSRRDDADKALGQQPTPPAPSGPPQPRTELP